VEGDLIVGGNDKWMNSGTSTESLCTGQVSAQELLSYNTTYGSAIYVDDSIYAYSWLPQHFSRLNLDTMNFEALSSPLGRFAGTIFSPLGTSSIFIAGGFNETFFDTTVFEFNVLNMTWHEKSNSGLQTSEPISACTLKACYVHGGKNYARDAPVNVFSEYNFEKDTWRDLFNNQTPKYMDHAGHYLPHMDSLVIFGGLTPDNSSGTTVGVFNIYSSIWTNHLSVDQFIEQTQLAIVLDPITKPASVVFDESIFILSGGQDDPSLIRLSFDMDQIPTFYRMQIEHNGLLELSMEHQCAILLGGHALLWGGTTAGGVPSERMLMISLC